MAFPDRLYLVLADVHLQVVTRIDLSVAMGMTDEALFAELRSSSLHILRYERVDTISDDDRVAVSEVIATAFQAFTKRIFGKPPTPPPGEAEQVLERAYAAAAAHEQSEATRAQVGAASAEPDAQQEASPVATGNTATSSNKSGTLFPDRLLPVLARVHQQLMEGIDLSVATRLSDAALAEEIRIASLALMQMSRTEVASDEDRAVIADTLARAFTERTERLFGGRTQMGAAEQVLAKAVELSEVRAQT